MALVRGADGGNAARMGACRQPIEQLGADCAAPLATIGGCDRARLASNHQQQPRTDRHGMRQPSIKPGVRGIKRVAVEIERQVRRYLRLGQLALP